MDERSSKPKVIIVDDDRDTREMLTLALELEGFEVCQAANGLRLISAMHVDRPDVILLDVMMSWIDGFELCRAIKKNPTFGDIPVIFITARKSAGGRAGRPRGGRGRLLHEAARHGPAHRPDPRDPGGAPTPPPRRRLRRSRSLSPVGDPYLAGCARARRRRQLRRGSPARGLRGAAPPALSGAIAYALLGGGKRLRPALVLAACRGLRGRRRDGLAGHALRGRPGDRSTPTRSSTTTCPAWTTTTCGAGAPPCTGPSTRRPPCWRATRSSRWPSRHLLGRRLAARRVPGAALLAAARPTAWWRARRSTSPAEHRPLSEAEVLDLMAPQDRARLLAASVAGGAVAAGGARRAASTRWD